MEEERGNRGYSGEGDELRVTKGGFKQLLRMTPSPTNFLEYEQNGRVSTTNSMERSTKKKKKKRVSTVNWGGSGLREWIGTWVF